MYEEGKVCLSLLNTWTGRGNEVWDPSTSSILQVLVSLQGLVLNAKPYFNEAGYDKQVGTAEGEKNSLSYNENTFLLNCKMMMYLMRRPPKVINSTLPRSLPTFYCLFGDLCRYSVHSPYHPPSVLPITMHYCLPFFFVLQCL